MWVTVPVQGGYQLSVIIGVHDWCCMTQRKWILRELLDYSAPFFLKQLRLAEHSWANPPVGQGGKPCKVLNTPVEKEAEALSIFTFRPRDAYLNFTWFLFEGGPDWKNQKPVELWTKPAQFSAFSFLPSQFPPLTLVQLSPDQQALRTPIKP